MKVILIFFAIIFSVNGFTQNWGDSARCIEIHAYSTIGIEKDSLQKKAAELYTGGGEYHEAERIYLGLLSDSVVIFNAAMNAFLWHQPEKMQFWLHRFEENFRSESHQFQFLQGAFSFLLGEDQKAFTQWSSRLSPEQLGPFQKQWNQMITQSRRPNKAAWLSALLPGLGQWYAGARKQGWNALLLNTTLVSAGIVMGIHTSPVLAIMWLMPITFRYYYGNIIHAKDLAIRKNNLLRHQFLRFAWEYHQNVR